MSWWRLAKAGNLPPAAVNGTPRKVYRCPDCRATWADVETAFEHVMAGCPERKPA